METTDTQEIDIESIVRSRLGKRSRYVPNALFRWLKNFIHQDFINEYLRRGRTGVDFCTGALEYLGVTVKVEGREHLPHDDRRLIF